jgi:hypothetical protein
MLNGKANARTITRIFAPEVAHSIITYDEKPLLIVSCEAQNEFVPF